MSFEVDPMPEMVSQRFSYIPEWLPIIDPTCGRYCLKALLKYHYEKHLGTRLPDINLPAPESTIANWIGYDPIEDFQHAQTLLQQKNHNPSHLDVWEYWLRVFGPIILSGKLGQATAVEHAILLVGVDTNTNEFLFKDPLAGDTIQREAYGTMQPKITGRPVYGTPSIGTRIASVNYNELWTT